MPHRTSDFSFLVLSGIGNSVDRWQWAIMARA